MTRAISSLPVPDSPWIRTVAREAATRPTSLKSFCIDGEVPTMSSILNGRDDSTETNSAPRLLREAEAFGAGGGRIDAEAALLEVHREQLADAAVVVDDEDAVHFSCRRSRR